MLRSWRGARTAALVTVSALALAACDVGGDESREVAPSGAGVVPERAFDELRVALDSGLDYLDPALSYTLQGWSIMADVHLGLLTYERIGGTAGGNLVPALAEQLPEVSEDGRTYTFRLREGLTYSNGRTVRASDFEWSVQRLLRLDSLATGFFSGIEGAARFARTNRGEIGGIVTDDETRTIEITLSEPRADFLHVLATTFGALVPRGTPADDRSTARIPATGPYMVEAYEPDRRVVLVRNPRYRAIEKLPLGNPDRIVLTVFEDESAALDSVVRGRNDYLFQPVPVERVDELREDLEDRVRLYTPANTYYFFLDTQSKPFQSLDVRKAVNYAIDREEVVELFGGLATPTQNLLPPMYAQYRKLSLYSHDLDEARELVRGSGELGTRVTVWGSSRENLRRPAQYLVDVLNELGLRARLRIVDPAVYFASIGNRRTGAQAGIAMWFQESPHPLNWFDTLVNGNRIADTNNTNYSNADVPEVNERIEELKDEPELTSEVNEAWAALDRLVLEEALIVPIVNRQFAALFGPELDLEECDAGHVVFQFLYSAACKKG